MSSPFVAEIRMFAGSFAPTGWALCNGQLLPISQNTALFSLLGTMYGGDGKSTFALPGLLGSAPMMWGQTSGGTNYGGPGEQVGTPYVTLITTEMPVHTHNLMADAVDTGDRRDPNPTVTMSQTSPGSAYQNATSPLSLMNPQTISVAGSSLPHNNYMPTLAVTIIIALQGVFPARQ